MAQKSRSYIMVQAEPDEKEEFKQAAKARGFNAVSTWVKWVAKRDMRAVMKKDIPNA